MLVAFVSVMHLMWAILLIMNGGPLHFTATNLLSFLIPDWHTRVGVYMVVSVLPALRLIWPRSLLAHMSTSPQLLVLMTSAISAFAAILVGHYADGTIRDSEFIAADQAVYLVLSVFYALESIERYHRATREFNVRN